MDVAPPGVDPPLADRPRPAELLRVSAPLINCSLAAAAVFLACSTTSGIRSSAGALPVAATFLCATRRAPPDGGRKPGCFLEARAIRRHPSQRSPVSRRRTLTPAALRDESRRLGERHPRGAEFCPTGKTRGQRPPRGAPKVSLMNPVWYRCLGQDGSVAPCEGPFNATPYPPIGSISCPLGHLIYPFCALSVRFLRTFCA
jgi:hypothetical protein